MIDGNFYLLDLVEAGIEKSPKIPKPFKRYPMEVEAFVSRSSDQIKFVDFLTADEKRAVIRVFSAIEPFERDVLVGVMRMYHWDLVDLPLVNVEDEETGIAVDPKNLFQLATRRDDRIAVNKRIWKKLDLRNKVALVLHEALYSLVRPTPTRRR